MFAEYALLGFYLILAAQEVYRENGWKTVYYLSAFLLTLAVVKMK